MKPRFADRIVLVTGASRGLGRAIAAAFAAEGAYVVIGHRAHVEQAAETLASIRASGGDGETLAFDVRDTSAVDSAVGGVIERRGAIDVLVNNAGVLGDSLLATMTDSDWQDVIATDLGGVFACSRAVARPMAARQSGAIVNVASVSALRANPGQANYAAAKAGVLAFTRTLAAELAPSGVRVNAVVPGLISTGMGARLDRRAVARTLDRIPIARLGRPDEVASAVLFLASAQASYIVGHAFVVDGGLSL